jgi:hypothetical protein
LQSPQVNTQAKACKRVCLPNRTETATQRANKPRQTEGQLVTAPTRNWRFSASYDSFVVNQTFGLRMNICGKNRQLLVAAKR